MTAAFRIDQTQRVGELSLVNRDGTTVDVDGCRNLRIVGG
jgi:hypothetical protein